MTSALAPRLQPAGTGARGPRTLPASVEASRAAILGAIGDPPDVTFVRGVGNLGDEMISAGARQLLGGLAFREISLFELSRASGHTAVITGSGAWCRPYHELMPYLLPLAEVRFERVIVLPSSFDLRVEEVRDALSRTRATIFAREIESYEQLRAVCGGVASLAYDCGFFLDLSAVAARARMGRGTLLAFRGDAEAVGAVPAGNVDISVECASLDHWLWTIASYEVVRTDRAHVMIAAARLGKRVEYRPSSYHKVPGIAAYSLAGYDVRPLAAAAPPASSPPGTTLPAGEASAVPTARAAAPAPDMVGSAVAGAAAAGAAAAVERVRARLLARARQNLASLPPLRARGAGGEPRVTVVVLTQDRSERWPRLLASIRDSIRLPYRLVILDNASQPAARAELARLCGELFAISYPAGEEGGRGAAVAVEIRWLDENLGCAAGRKLAVSKATTEYLVFLDDDAELFPGTVEHLVADLDAFPAAVAAGALLVLPDGSTQLCGGEHWVEAGGILHLEPLAHGLDFEDPAVGGARACGWLAGAATAFRAAALLRDPIDAALGAYYEDTEWCYRVGRTRPGALFRRVPAAFALHHQELKGPRGASEDEEVRRALPFLAAIDHFYRTWGLILEGIFVFAPHLAKDGRRDPAAARLLLELLAARGPDWLAEQWLNGGLAPLFRMRTLLPEAPPPAWLPAGAEGEGAAPPPAQEDPEDPEAVRRDLDAARAGLTLHERELAVLRADLVASRHDGRALRAELKAVHDLRIWRLADLYWRSRRALLRLAGRGRRG